MITDYRKVRAAAGADLKRALDDATVAALREFKGAGIDRGAALSVAALARNEGASIWATERHSIVYPNLPCNRTIVVLERAADGRTLRPELLEDTTIRNWLTSKGYITPDPQDGTKYVPANGLGEVGGDAIANLFEVIYDRRHGPSLKSISLGPTGVYMGLSPMAGGTDARKPPTWEAAWQFYTTDTVAGLWNSYLQYLAAAPGTYPADQPTNQSVAVTWLVRNTGNAAAATTYYTNIYKGHLDATMLLNTTSAIY